MLQSTNPLIILTGPTAAGKTKLSIALAKAVNGEIISADSMQVYRHMNIGSAKIQPEEMQGVKHYLVDLLEPTQDFNIFLFQKLAKQAIAEIYAKGKIPILVGGTGFYIQSVLYDIDFKESAKRIYDKIRGLRPWADCFCNIEGRICKIKSIKILETSVPSGCKPNNILKKTSEKTFHIACKNGAVEIEIC